MFVGSFISNNILRFLISVPFVYMSLVMTIKALDDADMAYN